MKGKFGLVVGLAAGYVLGARAGRQRYAQIKQQASKVWHLDPVQKQVDKVKDLGGTALLALPNAVWDSAVKVTKAATGKGTAGEKLDAAVDAGKGSASDIEHGAQRSAEEVKKAAADAAGDGQKAADS